MKGRLCHAKRLLSVVLMSFLIGGFGGTLLSLLFPGATAAADNPEPPASPVKLIFVHHSTGENWLADGNGGLGLALRQNNYFVSDTYYGWGPEDLDSGGGAIGDHTDIGHWYNWFAGPHRSTYLRALYSESDQHCEYSRLAHDPGGNNNIIMFKSCFPNSNLGGLRNAPATKGDNPLRGQDSGSEYMTVANAKGIYKDILKYFRKHQEKLFIVVTAPPLSNYETTRKNAGNARAFNNWLVNKWLRNYPYENVAVYDFYNVLTSNGGNRNKNDVDKESGNHHRWWNGAIQHIKTLNRSTSAYRSDNYDSHPTQAGNEKATAEFVSFLNVMYNRWQASLAGGSE
jgi:hypothetical protein